MMMMMIMMMVMMMMMITQKLTIGEPTYTVTITTVKVSLSILEWVTSGDSGDVGHDCLPV